MSTYGRCLLPVCPYGHGITYRGAQCRYQKEGKPCSCAADIVMNYIVFEHGIYNRALERRLYAFCRRRKLSLWRFVFIYLLYDFLCYFHIISRQKYLAKHWSFLRELDAPEFAITAFARKNKKRLHLPPESMTVLSTHPRKVIELLTGMKTIAGEYSPVSETFSIYRNLRELPEGEYTAYGTARSPIMRRAARRIMIDGDRIYLSRADYVRHWIIKYVFSFGIMLASSLFWTTIHLYYASRPFSENLALFGSYFNHPMIFMLNALPVLFLCAVFYLLSNRVSVACFLSGAVTYAVTLGNYFKISLRSDPLIAADIVNLSEAANISDRYTIEFTPVMIALAVFLLVSCVVIRLLFEARIRIRYVRLFSLLLAGVIGFFGISSFYMNDDVYETYDNTELIDIWASIEQYMSRGCLYPFLHSISTAFDNPPENYTEQSGADILAEYEDGHIPDDEKVDIISIMLEAYSDFSRFEGLSFTEDPYAFWHDLQKECYSGYLVDDIFAGGTIMTERSYLTGYAYQPSYTKSLNSYVRYFASEGYRTEGSHSGNDWFYSRKNVNKYLGFEDYYFAEDTYFDLSGGSYCADNNILLPNIVSLWQQNAEGDGDPYFSFNVTYQGHGPYDTEVQLFDREYVANTGFSEETYNMLNNYLDTVRQTGDEFYKVIASLRASDRPVLLVLFGDHMPWMGNESTGYEEMGISFDLSTEEGFCNYYCTPYYIWANEAAREVLGDNFRGSGDRIGPYYLMNEVFRLCGWTGSAYMQFMDDCLPVLPVVHMNGTFFNKDGMTHTLNEQEDAVWQRLKTVQYYYSHQSVGGS